MGNFYTPFSLRIPENCLKKVKSSQIKIKGQQTKN
jgi:hypothetical protein